MSKTSFFKQSGTNNVGTSGNDATDPTEIADSASDSSFFKQNGVNSEVNSNLTQRATDAETAKTAAEAAQSAAETAATNAAASETAAQSSANSASTSSSTASTSATTATTKASEASASASNASSSASAAATSASNASTSETNAATSATTASTAATSAQTAQTAAETAKTAAETAKTAAETAKTSAETAETNSASAATSASNSAATATTEASTATTKASEAATSATNAATSATNASTSATASSNSASSAASAQTAAEAARDSALTALDNFDDRYLGSKTSDPTVDNDGNALVGGSLFFDSTNGIMKVYTGSAWVAAYASTAGTLLVANNLSDVQSAATSRTNLGLSTVAATGAYSDLTGKPSLFDGAFSSLSGKPTTISGYGITDAFDGAFSSLSGKPTTIAGYGITDALQLGTTSTTALAGNTSIPTTLTDLGISDGSANQVLSTNGSGTFTFVNQSGGGGATQDADGDTKIQVEESTDDDTIRFDTAGSERMSILSSGNILIGKSAPNTNASGLELYNDGAIALARSGRPLYVNRLSTEGNVIDVAKDGTLIGSIGVIATNNLYLSNAADGIGLGIGDDNLYPVNATGGANGNNVDIGDSTVRFRNLYLSGDINVTGCSIPKFYNNAYLDSSTTTANLISELTNDYGAFNNNYVILKCAWSYAGNSDLVTGHSTIGTIELAGCVVEAWGGTYKHIRITRPTTGTGGSTIAVYNDQGSSYSPAWREIWNSSTDGSGSGLDADLLDGLQLHTGRNNEANKVVRSNSSGYVDFGWINTTSGSNGSNSIDRVYSSNDGYIRYSSATNFLHRQGLSYYRAYNWVEFRDTGAGLYWSNSTGSGWHIYPQSTAYMRIRSGHSSVGGLRCNVAGTDRNYIYWNNSNQVGFLSSGGGWILKVDNSGNTTATGNVTAYSDIRLKTDIEPIKDALDKVTNLEGIEYTRKSTGEREIGFVAQNVKEVVPELVDVIDASTEEQEALPDLHVMKYQNTTALLVEAVKELKAEVDTLRQEIAELKKEG